MLAYQIVRSAPAPYRSEPVAVASGAPAVVPLAASNERARAIAPKGADGVEADEEPVSKAIPPRTQMTPIPKTSPAPKATATPGSK
jgi:hypothetical protein